MTEAFRGFLAQRLLPRGGERMGLHTLTLPLDVERTEDVALPPGDLVHAGAVALSRMVPGHPCLVEEAPDAWPPSSSPPCVHLRCHAAGMSATNTTRGLPAKVPSADTRGVLRSGSPPAPPRGLGRPRRPQGHEHDRKIDRLPGA